MSGPEKGILREVGRWWGYMTRYLKIQGAKE